MPGKVQNQVHAHSSVADNDWILYIGRTGKLPSCRDLLRGEMSSTSQQQVKCDVVGHSLMLGPRRYGEGRMKG